MHEIKIKLDTPSVSSIFDNDFIMESLSAFLHREFPETKITLERTFNPEVIEAILMIKIKYQNDEAYIQAHLEGLEGIENRVVEYYYSQLFN